MASSFTPCSTMISSCRLVLISSSCLCKLEFVLCSSSFSRWKCEIWFCCCTRLEFASSRPSLVFCISEILSSCCASSVLRFIKEISSCSISDVAESLSFCSSAILLTRFLIEASDCCRSEIILFFSSCCANISAW
uniref:Uncharacterized protein n=1 Tax=Setaria italica TaxID=4555 RepID=K3XT37_SETIT